MRTKTDFAKEEIFRSLPVPVALRKMIVPAVVSQLIVLIYNMADTFFVGQTNNPYMVAGTSLILPVFNITLCLAGLAGIGGGSLIARLLGQAKEQEARRVSAFSFYLALGIAALFSVGIGGFYASHPGACWARGKTPMNTPGNTRCASSSSAGFPLCFPTCSPT